MVENGKYKEKKNNKKNIWILIIKMHKTRILIMYFNTLFFSWMSLLDALDFTIQEVSNPKERERYRNNQSKREIWLFSLLVRFL